MHLRRRRVVYAGRRTRRWRLPLTGGIFALLIGVACWAPLAPTVLAPVEPAALETPAPVAPVAPVIVPTPGAASPRVAVVVPPVPRKPPPPTATPFATVVPTPVVIPTLTATGQALLASVRSDRAAQWLKNHTETPLRSGPSDESIVFTRLPQWSLLKQVEGRPDWLLVEYGGDGDTREPGPGWVKTGDVGGVDPPTVWLNSARAGTVWSTSDAAAVRMVDLPPRTLMEAIGPEYVQGTRVHVRLPGDGRFVPPSQGWVDGEVLARTRAPSPADLPWAYPDSLSADVRINVPYRTQLDGSEYEGSNCGPTVLGMALESFGLDLAPPELRGDVLNSEDFNPTDNDAGSFIWALAQVAQEHGIAVHGLYELGGDLHRWTIDEIRESVRHKRPVIVQVVYRGLPGREASGYYGDHYIIVTGLLGDNFLYNDPIGGLAANEAPGYDRVMSPSQLRRAMHASDSPYAFAAFSLGQ